MSAEEAREKVPESTKAVITLLKEGMVKKSVMLTLIRVILLSIAIIFSIGKASEHISMKMTVTEMDMFNKLALAQKDVSDKLNIFIADLKTFNERLTDLEYYTGKKKTKQ